MGGKGGAAFKTRLRARQEEGKAGRRMEARDRGLKAINDKLDRILRILGEKVDTTERDTIPAPPVRTSWRQVGMAYRTRFLEAKRGQVLDYHIQRHQQHWEDLGIVVDGYPDPKAALDKALTHFFKDAWAQRNGFPPGALLKGFEKYHDHSEPVVKLEDEPDEEAINARRIRERRIEEQRALEAKLNSHAQTASKPPALEELLVGIGRRM